jgi:hypothetical protein
MAASACEARGEGVDGRDDELGRPGLERAAWLALAVSFSPVLVDAVRSVTRDPTDAYAPAVLVLVALATRGAARGPARRGSALLLALGLGLEIVGIAGGTWSLARVGLPLAICGLAARFGLPPAPVAALAFFAVPLPDSVAGIFAEPVAAALARGSAALVPGVEATGPLLRAPGGARTLDLGAHAGLLVLAHELAAVGWYRAVERGAGLREAVRRAAWATLLAPLLALVAAFAAALLMLADRPHHATRALPAVVAIAPPVLAALYTRLRRNDRASPARSSVPGEPSIRA